MADARVKNMLKQFESNDNSMSAGRGKKPDLAVKPVLQKFHQMKENAAAAAATNSTTETSSPASSSSPAPKPSGHKTGQPGVKLLGLGGGSDTLSKPSLNSANNKDSNDVVVTEKRRVSVPKVFQNGTTTDSSNDSNNNKPNGDISSLSKKFVNTSSVSSDNKPQYLPKFPNMVAGSNQNKFTHSPKPPLSGPKPDNNNTSSISSSSNNNNNNIDKTNNTINKLDSNRSPPTNNKTALLPKNTHAKTDSISSMSSNSSTSSSSNQTANVSSPSQTPASSSSIISSPSPSESGVNDLRSQLRKVTNTSGPPPVKRVLSDASSVESSSSTPKSPTSPTFPNVSTSFVSTSSSSAPKPEMPSRVPPIPTSQLRRKQSDEVIVRKSDGKKFRKVSLPVSNSGPAPAKPIVPTDVDLTKLREQYQKAKNVTEPNNAKLEEECEYDDDLYADGASQNIPNRRPTPPKKQGEATNRTSERVSLIPEMSAEEEGIEFPEYDDTPIEEEGMYVDAQSEQENLSRKKTSVSSEPQSPTESEADKRKRLKEETAAKKREERERRDKEKKEREEEKKRRKKEEEEQKIRTKFNLTGQEKMVGEGVIKQDAKASGLNLKVIKGQIVTIVRLDSNPPNKWLVKAENQMGYVDSQNIEVDPNIIRQAMTGEAIEEEQPTYDDVPEEIARPAVPYPEEEDGEEIYEECS